MINAGIVGGTGYTGVELIRILAHHPKVRITAVTSRSDKGVAVSELYPNLRGAVDCVFCEPDVKFLMESACDVVFFATPNGTAMGMAPILLDAGIRVVDLSADFRLKDPEVWEKWYGEPHRCPELLEQAVYGLPETSRDQIAEGQLIACPGCYPTAVQLGFMPIIEADLVDSEHLIADVKSGLSGAGRKAQVTALMSEVGESFKAYSASGHRHLPEICQELDRFSRHSVSLTFVPHLVPMIRGIHATLYATLRDKDVDIQAIFEKRYATEIFVDVLPKGAHPRTGDVKGSNRCQIALHRPQNDQVIVVLSVIDNLVKGAAGQAVQCMNLSFGFDESLGLNAFGIYP